MSAAILVAPAALFECKRAFADAAGRRAWFWTLLDGNVVGALGLNLAAITCLQSVGAMAM